MFKKYGQLFTGIIIGIVIALAIPVCAAVQEYKLNKADVKLIVNGHELKNEQLPVLNYNGYNYIPASTFKDICAAIGVDFQWNGAAKRIEIGKVTTTTPQAKEDTKVNEEITQTPDGITQIDTWEGKQYIAFSYIRKKIREKGYDLKSDLTNKWSLVKGDEILIDNVPTIRIYGADEIEVNYYINTILPLIK